MNLILNCCVILSQHILINQTVFPHLVQPADIITPLILRCCQTYLAILNIITIVGTYTNTAICTECTTDTHIVETYTCGGIKCCAILLIEYTNYILKLRDCLRNFKTTLIQPVLTNNWTFVAVIPTTILAEESEGIVTTLIILHCLIVCWIGLQKCIIIRCILLNIIG